MGLDVVNWLALIFLTLFGYSVGAVLGAPASGKNEPDAVLLDGAGGLRGGGGAVGGDLGAVGGGFGAVVGGLGAVGRGATIHLRSGVGPAAHVVTTSQQRARRQEQRGKEPSSLHGSMVAEKGAKGAGLNAPLSLASRSGRRRGRGEGA